MLRKAWRKLNLMKLLFEAGSIEDSSDDSSKSEISPDLQTNLQKMREKLHDSQDLVFREFRLGTKGKVAGALVFVDGLVDNARVNMVVLEPLMENAEAIINSPGFRPADAMNILQSHIPAGHISIMSDFDDIVDSALSGTTTLFVHGCREALSLSTRSWPMRAVGEPDTESVVRGPREGFIEALRVNTGLLRRRLRSSDLAIKTFNIGERAKSEVSIAYIDGVVNPKLVEEVKRRLKRIKTDSIIGSGYLEEFIEDAPFSMFPTIGNTERPDLVAANLLEGRVAILVEGTPMVLTVPYLFVESFQSPEDYYSRPYYSSVVRWLRYLAFGFSILLPAVYVALTTYHQELIPTSLLLSMAAAREGTPFPAVIEASLMGIIFEVLREAGIRMPRPVGQAVSIVGALVLGDAAVSSGLIGAPMVIVVSLTAISSFLIPPQTDSSFFLRFFFLLLAAIGGAYGIILGLLALLVHLSTLRSFGVPYLSPLAPLSPGDLKDVLYRAPLWKMFNRPRAIGLIDPQRQEFRLMPHPPKDGEEADNP